MNADLLARIAKFHLLAIGRQEVIAVEHKGEARFR